MVILYFVIGIGFLIMIHEWGHFYVARKCGIRVLKFSIGFGPKLFGFTRGGTEYKVSLLPLGGYVQMHGEDPSAEADGNEAKALAIAHEKDSFAGRPVWARLATVFAGPAMNLLFALVMFPMVYILGKDVPSIVEKAPVVLGVMEKSPAASSGIKVGDHILKLNGQPLAHWQDYMEWVALHPKKEMVLVVSRDGKEQEIKITTDYSPYNTQDKIGYTGIEPTFFWGNDPIVGTLSEGKPAELAGLKKMDKILSVNGEKIDEWIDFVLMIRGGFWNDAISYAKKIDPRKLHLQVERDKKVVEIDVVPAKSDGYWAIGVGQYQDTIKKKYPFFKAVQAGVHDFVKLTRITGEVLGQLVTGNRSYKELSGPVKMAKASAMMAEKGLSDFLFFMAYVSLQLGLMNLLPIPVVDGGHVVFMTIEAIRGKPLSEKIRRYAMTFGLIFLLSLMLAVTFNDVDSVWGFGNILQKIRGWF